jgi:PhzF family phenazine biosynthesis protein
MRVKVYLLKSFGVNENGGNPAGVVLDADGLSDAQKKKIAEKVGFSETAFLEKSDKADFKLRFFTPTAEVDLCGHATIATYALLFQKKLLEAGRYVQELNLGSLAIEVQNNGFVLMEQTRPIFLEFISPDDIQECVNIKLSFDELKPQVVSTGLADILLPVSSLVQLNNLVVDTKKLSLLNKRTNSIGLHAFTLHTTRADSVAQTRNFAPLYGINEESATGSSNCALACYLFKSGKLSNHSLGQMRFEQGYHMDQPSEIFVTLGVQNNLIKQVVVGGTATLTGELNMEI